MKCWTNRWKKKAVKRRIKIRKLEKRLIELGESRDQWKAKAKTSKIELQNTVIELNDLKKNE